MHSIKDLNTAVCVCDSTVRMQNMYSTAKDTALLPNISVSACTYLKQYHTRRYSIL